MGLGTATSDLEELEEVVELAVDVTAHLGASNQKKKHGTRRDRAYSHRGLDGAHVELLVKDFLGSLAQLFHFFDSQQFTLVELDQPNKKKRLSIGPAVRHGPAGRRDHILDRFPYPNHLIDS